jgi:hypothetical protein
MNKPEPGKVQIIWGSILFLIQFWTPTHLDSYSPFVMDIFGWVGVGLIVYGSVKDSRGSKG